MAQKCILVADADTQLLEDFRQALGAQWQVTGVTSGTAARAAMKQQVSDVIIVSLDLPEISAAELLNQTRRKNPQTVRFIMARGEERERVMKNVLGAHQFLPKPIDFQLARETIERALTVEGWLANDNIRKLAARVRSFPVMPALYLEVLAALRNPDATTEQVGAIISKDMAMMTKVLQVLNSAYFGLSQRISDPSEAIGILGFETVKSLVMTVKLLSQYDKLKSACFSMEALWQHSTDVAQAAKDLVLMHNGDRNMAATAFTAGLMHDLGKVILAANFDEQYGGAHSLARKQQLPLCDIEKEIFGATHGEIGAYLFGLWGMPLDLIEVLAFHHEPGRTIHKEFSALTAVHVANALEYEFHPHAEGMVPPRIDQAYLEEIGVLERLSLWHAAVETHNFDNPVSEPPKKPESHEAAVAVAAVSAPASLPVERASDESPDVELSSETPPYMSELEPAGAPPGRQWMYAGMGIVIAVFLAVFAWMKAGQWMGDSHDKGASERPKSQMTGMATAAPVADPGAAQAKPEESKTPRVASSSTVETVVKTPDINSAVSPSPNPALLAAAPEPAPVTMAAAEPAQVVAAVPAFPDLKLQGVIFSTVRPSAIINGRMVRQNERMSGALVLEISRSNVVVEYQNQRKTLSLRR